MTYNRFLNNTSIIKINYSYLIVTFGIIIEFAILESSPILQYFPIILLKILTFYPKIAS